ncbi:MAG TPA: ABC transporter substrate-binding protein [Candidatus Lustribacter sp.]|nr:ABC transporter substrate-binding protein [Candidatus Lustribacter sp.]
MRDIPRSSALTLIAGALAAARPASAQTAPPVVRVGATAIDACGVAYYGVENGMFLNAGINVQVTTLNNGASIMAAVSSGDLDVGMTNTPQLAVAIARGIPFQMIAPASLYSKKDADPNLVVAKDGPIKSARDLVDATIGVSSLGDFNQLSVLGWFDANKVPHDRVKFVELKFGEMGAALQRGTVQAAILTEPAKSDAIRAGQIRDLADTYISIAPEIATIVWFSTKPWVQKNPDLARKLVGEIYTIAKWANANPRDTAPILAKVAKIDPAVVATLLRRIYATTNDRRYVEAILTLAGRYGMLAHPLTFEDYSAYSG